MSQLAARSGLPLLSWPALDRSADPDAVYAAERHLSRLAMDGWDMRDVSGAYEYLLNPKERMDKSAFYTPPEVAAFMVWFSLGEAAEMLAADPDPRAILQILAVDPSCGARVFLIEAARFIATVLAERLAGRPDPKLIGLLMPDVMAKCVFGMDIDPVAIDLARAALWFEVGGAEPSRSWTRTLWPSTRSADPTRSRRSSRGGSVTASARRPESARSKRIN